MVHSSQLIDGSNVTAYIGQLALPKRPTGIIADNTIIFFEEPPLLPIPGSTTASMTLGKNNTPFRLFNDDGWEQSKIISQSFQISLTTYFVKNTSPIESDTAFAILDAAALADEEEVYVKLRKFLGLDTTGAGTTYTVYYTYAGTAKVVDFSENLPADGLAELTLTLAGSGKLYIGREKLIPPAEFYLGAEPFTLDGGEPLLV